MELISYSVPFLSISNCVTITLTERNYILWKSQFESFLSGQGLLGFVTGSFQQPPNTISVPGINGNTTETPNPEYQIWFKTDQVVKSWLLGSFSEDILSVVVGCTTAHEVWLSLAKHFNRVSSSRLFELQRKLQTVTKNDKPMDVYLKEVKNICDQLESIGNPVTEKMKIFAALHGLGRDYEPIKTSIEGTMDSYPSPIYEDIIPRLTSYHDRLQAYAIETTISPHLAFNTTRSDGYTASYNHRGRGNSYGRYGRGRSSFSTRGRGFHQQISSSIGSGRTYGSNSENNGVTCQICGRMGHPALKCWHRFNNSYQYEELPSALAAMKITDVSDNSGQEWFPDTGATAHITRSQHHLQQSQPYLGSDLVMSADGNYLPITHTGSASLPSTSGTLPLKDVLVCPNIAKSLLSVSKLTSDYPCSFEFDCNGVRITDKGTKRLLALGSNHNGLYLLKEPPVQALVSSRQNSASYEVWHQRLGHPNPQVLQHLAINNGILINKAVKTICDICQLGKSSRLPFYASTYVASRPLERIHCDL